MTSAEFTMETLELSDDIETINNMAMDCTRSSMLYDPKVNEMIYETVTYIVEMQNRINRLVEDAIETMPIIELIPYRFNMAMMYHHLERLSNSLLKIIPVQVMPS